MAKLKVTDRAVSDLGQVIHTTVELLDSHGTMVEYGVKEYHDDHQGKIIDVEIENMTNGRDVGENSITGKAVLAEIDKYNNQQSDDNDNISVSEKVNHFLADIGIIDEHFEDQIHTLIIHYTKYKKHQQDLYDELLEYHLDKDVVPCSAELDQSMQYESE
tara:strand:+ start:162 stop:641 length:480 start_codon:yes stop_codon:yes gene_type:complete